MCYKSHTWNVMHNKLGQMLILKWWTHRWELMENCIIGCAPKLLPFIAEQETDVWQGCHIVARTAKNY
jgi:hypothetical protein